MSLEAYHLTRVRKLVEAQTGSALPSLVSLQVTHIFLLALAGAGAAAAFSLVVGRWLRSLDELREAARQIGKGDLVPWLPPPGDDELGWLTRAFGRMADRINHMIRRIDQSSRLEVAGVMASHLAHELRNPLSSIRLNLQGLSRDMEAGRIPVEYEPNIQISLREVARLERTVKTVLQVAGGRPVSEEAPANVSLHEIVTEASDVLAPVLEESGISIELDLAAETDTVHSNEGRLKGVFMNLFVNASEAMAQGGRITVESGLFLDHEGRHIIAVSVTDTGPGVPPEVRDDIFSPFFTTRPDGSGIGLAVALRSVRDEGGDLFLSDASEAGGGARFVVVLPVVDRSLQEGASMERVPEEPADAPVLEGVPCIAPGEELEPAVCGPEVESEPFQAGVSGLGRFLRSRMGGGP